MLQFKPEHRPTLDYVYESLKPNISLILNQNNQPIAPANTMVI
jgi:hypothetical protein